MRWAEFVERYLSEARGRGLATQTLISYRTALNRFAAYLAGLGLERAPDILPEHLARYRDERAAVVSYRSLVSDLRPVLIALRWAVRQGLLLLDPGAGLSLQRAVPRPVPRYTPAQLERLLEARWERSPKGLRDRAILELFYGTGLRLREAAALDLADLDLAGRQLHVRQSKNGQARLVPLGPRLAERLRAYLEQARPWLGPATHPALWLSPKGRLAAGSLAAAVVRAGRLVGLTVSPHDLRRAFASHLLAGGARLAEVRALLGHLDPASTTPYVEVTEPMLARELRRTHPRARGRRPNRSAGG